MSSSANAKPYYQNHGAGCDYVLRCNACRKLVTALHISKHGTCDCGSTKFVEPRTLTAEEFAAISSGEIDFPHREEFLAEFAPRESE